MKMSPFNLCDYRCERCLETERCAVFRMLQERALNDSVLDQLRESFRETEEMIKQKALQLGIDIDGMAGGGAGAEIRDVTLDDPLYKDCRVFAMETKRLIETLNKYICEQDGEYVKDLAWHHSVIVSKIYRALGWKNEQEIALDAKNSAAVAMKSLTICVMAFEQLSRHTVIAGECSRLSSVGLDLKARIRKRFQTNKP
jgi:hypothetical protein